MPSLMNATLFYRIASVLFILFAVGHTFGFLTFRPPTSEGQAVLEAMNRVQLTAAARSFSYGGWYRGFGLTITASMLFWAFLSWYLGDLVHTAPQTVGALGWAFFAVQVAGVVMAVFYFGPPAIVLGALVALLVGAGAWLTPR